MELFMKTKKTKMTEKPLIIIKNKESELIQSNQSTKQSQPTNISIMKEKIIWILNIIMKYKNI